MVVRGSHVTGWTTTTQTSLRKSIGVCTVPAHRPAMLRTAILLLSLLTIMAQRSRHFEEEDEYGGNSLRPNSDVGDFPFPRGERPIFNFDQGDEVGQSRSKIINSILKNIYFIQGFIATIPELIEGLDKIKDVMNQQRKITQSFGEAFDQCESCG